MRNKLDKIVMRFTDGKKELVLGFRIERGFGGKYYVKRVPDFVDMKFYYFETLPLGMLKKCKDDVVIRVFSPKRAVVKIPHIEVDVTSAVVPSGNIVKVDPPARLRLEGLTLTYEAGSVSITVEKYELVWRGRKYKHENIGPSGVVCTGDYKPRIPVDPDSEEFCYYAMKVLRDVINVLSTPNALSAYHRSFTIAVSREVGVQ